MCPTNQRREAMKSYGKLKAEMEAAQRPLIGQKNNGRAGPFKKLKQLCKGPYGYLPTQGRTT